MKILIISFLLLCCFSNPANAQYELKQAKKVKNAVDIELGGAAILYSVNYERTLMSFPKSKIICRIGISTIPRKLGDLTTTTYYSLLIPYEFNYVKQIKGNHYVELGLSSLQAWIHDIKRKGNAIYKNGQWIGNYEEIIFYNHVYMYAPRIGYRYQKTTKSWLFRIGVMPYIYDNGVQQSNVFWGGISLGKSF
jgi:hypothetical protein